MNTQDLVQSAEEWEKEHASEIKVFDHFQASQRAYALFGPVHHCRKELVTPAMIEHLTSDRTARLLSVGAGPAYVERFLHEQHGIRKNQITLADYEADTMNQNFPQVVFNATKRWPVFDHPFSYVLFPESFIAINYRILQHPGRSEVGLAARAQFREGNFHMLRQATQALQGKGEVRGDGFSTTESCNGALQFLFEHTFPKLQIAVNGECVFLDVESPEQQLITQQRDRILRLFRFGEFDLGEGPRFDYPPPNTFQSPFSLDDL